jgi:hypothetical protein
MTNAWFLKRKVLQQCPKSRFGITAPVASAVEAAFKNILEASEILAQALKIRPNTVIIPVSPQLSVQFRKQHRYGQVAVLIQSLLEAG